MKAEVVQSNILPAVLELWWEQEICVYNGWWILGFVIDFVLNVKYWGGGLTKKGINEFLLCCPDDLSAFRNLALSFRALPSSLLRNNLLVVVLLLESSVAVFTCLSLFNVFRLCEELVLAFWNIFESSRVFLEYFDSESMW